MTKHKAFLSNVSDYGFNRVLRSRLEESRYCKTLKRQPSVKNTVLVQACGLYF